MGRRARQAIAAVGAAGLLSLCWGRKGTGLVAVLSLETSAIHDDILAGLRAGSSFNSDLFRDTASLRSAIARGGYDAVIVLGYKASRALPADIKAPVLVTGVPNLFDDPDAKARVRVHMDVPHALQLSLIRQVHPRAKSVGVIYNPEKSGALAGQVRKALVSAGLEGILEPCGESKDVSPALERLRGKIDVLWVVMDPTLLSTSAVFEATSLFCLRNGIMMVVPAQPYVREGAVLGVTADYGRLGTLVARATEDILRGDSSARDYFLDEAAVFINQKAADNLGLVIPESVKKKAAKIY